MIDSNKLSVAPEGVLCQQLGEAGGSEKLGVRGPGVVQNGLEQYPKGCRNDMVERRVGR